MIPLHSLHDDLNKSIEVHRLNQLTNYDFGQPHRHTYFEFFYFEKGGGTHEIDFVSFPIHDNSIHIVAAGRVHQVKRELNSCGLVFLFDLAQFGSDKEFHGFLFEKGIYDVNEHSVTFQLSKKNELVSKNATEEFLNQTSNIMHLSIKNLIQNLIIQCLLVESPNHIKIDNTYSEFRKLVLREVRNRPSVSSIANELNVSIKTLNGLVKSNAGKSPSKVVQNQVCLEAKRLLLSGMTIKEVAYYLNFSDPGHFSKFFKSNLNISPSDFQKEQIVND